MLIIGAQRNDTDAYTNNKNDKKVSWLYTPKFCPEMMKSSFIHCVYDYSLESLPVPPEASLL